MSAAAKRTLFGSAVFCTLTIFGVHYGQIQESANMYQGVIKDEERRQAKLAKLAASPSTEPASLWSTASPDLSATQQAAVDGWEPPQNAETTSELQREILKQERRRDFERSQAREEKLKAEQKLI